MSWPVDAAQTPSDARQDAARPAPVRRTTPQTRPALPPWIPRTAGSFDAGFSSTERPRTASTQRDTSREPLQGETN
ncbi:hypothetical protein AOLI_G00041520 [Acnodon oligacanthus]